MSLLIPRRVVAHELLDEPDAPRADMERSLRDLRRFNSYCGGHRAYRKVLTPLLDSAATPAVVDLGSGTSDLIARIAKRRPIVAIALDVNIAHLLYGRNGSEDGVLRVVGDAKRLPFRDGSVDAVASSHVFHHFSEDENRTILAESLRVARRGVAVTDTRRHLLPLLFTRALAVLRLVGRITRYDAPASVLQGYTPEEVSQIAAAAPAKRAKVFSIAPLRFGLVLWK